MFAVDHGKFEEGRAAYERGASVLGLMEAVERHHKAFEELQYSGGDRYAHEIAGKSLMLGFIDGALGDIRKIAGALGNDRRGLQA